ncbi:WD repeat-containing protein 43-like [Arapaima gigas]
MAAGGSEPSFVAPCEFSPRTHQYLAVCGRDGTLRIYDTSRNSVQQELALSAQPGAVCTCISWAPSRVERPQRKRKRNKSEAGKVVDDEDLLALGTTAGSVVLYSVADGQLHSTLDEGHSGAVNCVQWHPEGHFLYSASEDMHIIEWNLLTGGVPCKWKADCRPVTSLCVSPDGQWILSAGQTIKMWNLESKEVYRRFRGHCTAVSTLCFATAHTSESDSLYFLSGATRDPQLCVWQVQSDRNKNAILSFILTDAPQHIDIADCDNKDQVLRMAVVCKDGQLHIFHYHLNGPCKTPLSPTCSVRVSSAGAQGSGGNTPVPLPLLAAVFSTEKDLLLAYGSHLQPFVERVVSTEGQGALNKVCGDRSTDLYVIFQAPNTAERNICLVRDVQTTLMVTLDSTVSKVIEMKTTAGQGGPDGTPFLQTDNFTMLLMQGLESSDNRLLNKVLQIRKEALIKKTVAKLPGPAILPLVVEVREGLVAVLMVRWLKAVLIQHTSYLSTLPDLSSSFGLLHLMIESRMKIFHKLTQLYGKLYLLITQQVAACDSTSGVTELDQGAKIVYEEESSDEDQTSGDEGLPEEDSDNWEEDEEGMEETLDKETRESSQLKEDPKSNSDSDFHQENESEEE